MFINHVHQSGKPRFIIQRKANSYCITANEEVPRKDPDSIPNQQMKNANDEACHFVNSGLDSTIAKPNLQTDFSILCARERCFWVMMQEDL